MANICKTIDFSSNLSLITEEDLQQMNKLINRFADNFTAYLHEAHTPVKFTGNVVPLKEEFKEFTKKPTKSQLILIDSLF